MKYETLNARLTGRCAQSKKLGNNTYAQRRDNGAIAIRLHQTDILTFLPSGEVVVDVGRWRTVTTKDRLNTYLEGYSISQTKGQWYWHCNVRPWNEGLVPFTNGDKIYGDKLQFQDVGGATLAKRVALRKRVMVYAKGFAAALPIQRPSGGDCWGCLMHEKGKESDPINMPLSTDHLLSHMDEKYYVPSLLMRAMQRANAGQAWYWTFFVDENGKTVHMEGTWGRKQAARWIRTYMYHMLGC